jgi:hypothetical protein
MRLRHVFWRATNTSASWRPPGRSTIVPICSSSSVARRVFDLATPYLLFASGDAWSGAAGHSRTRRHAHFTTTQRYMQLTPGALDHANGLLESINAAKFGDIVETGQA